MIKQKKGEQDFNKVFSLNYKPVNSNLGNKARVRKHIKT